MRRSSGGDGVGGFSRGAGDGDGDGGDGDGGDHGDGGVSRGAGDGDGGDHGDGGVSRGAGDGDGGDHGDGGVSRGAGGDVGTFYQSDEESDSSSNDEFAPQDMFDEWMVLLRLDQRKMLAVILMETFKNRWQLNAKDAATEAGSVVGFNEKTVRNYRNDFFLQMKGNSPSGSRVSTNATACITMKD